MFARKTLPFALLLALALPAVGSEQDSSATNDDTPNAVQSSVLKAARPQNNASILVGQSLENDIFEFTEVLRTRYPSGAVQIERHIRRDQNNEPINHGKWTMYTPEGDQIAHGTFCDGRPHGTWSRTYRGDEAKTILGASGQGFTLPLHSTATFSDGLLHGEWTILDDEQRKVRLWTFDREKLHGASVVWYPSGNRLREAEYDQGIPSGQHREWSPEGELLESNTFRFGRLLSEHRSTHDNGNVKSEGSHLLPRYRIATDVWWWDGNVNMSVTAKNGTRERTGLWSYYHENGKLAHTGEYLRNLPEGKHEWYHESGNLKATGAYLAGKPNGHWSWHGADGTLLRSQFFASEDEDADVQPANPDGGEDILAAQTGEAEKTASAVVPPVSPPDNAVQSASHDVPIPQTADAREHKNQQIRPAKILR